MDNEMPGKNICKHETDRFMACVEIGKLLTSTLDLKEILELILLKGNQLIEAQNWSVLLKDRETGELTFEVVVGINKDLIKNIRLAPGDGIACEVAETGRYVFLPDVQNHPRFNRKIDRITGFTTKSTICVPLKIHGKILGVIEILNVKDMEVFHARNLTLLTILADYAAIAIENSQYFSRIQKMSITDEYTGLYNTRYLHQFLEELVRKAHRESMEFAVVFVDVDNFKDVVDEHGHLLGSQVLKEVGATISSCLSEEDILVKYGGDEYVILLIGKSKKTSLRVTEKILQSVQSSSYLKSEPKPITLTASFGIAMYPEDGTTRKDLLLSADNSMYRIKKSSKNGIGMSSMI